MPSLTIPQSGLSFHGAKQDALNTSSGQEVFGLTLNDNVIEEMIRCFQNGKPIQLSLGEHPSLQYGTKVQHLSTSSDPFTHELFRSSNTASESEMSTNPSTTKLLKGSTTVTRKPMTAFTAMFINKSLKPVRKNAPSSLLNPSVTTSKSASTSDAAIAQLKTALASENAKKAENTTNFMKTGPLVPDRRGVPGSKATNKSKSQMRSLVNDTTRSIPSSPAFSGAGSPSLGPTSIPLSQQQAEKAKATRKPIIHLLALEPMSEETITSKLATTWNNELSQALAKVGDMNQSTKKYELRKGYWRELDVWTYKYGSSDDRQRAIDNAVRQYDKSRLGVSEPEWERLLPKAERGTGKSLSKLQAQIAQGLARPPRISVYGAEDSGRDTPAGKDNDDELSSNKALSKVKASEGPARSVSQPQATKSKRIGEKESQAKGLLARKNGRESPRPAPARKEKPKPANKQLSSQFVSDSDEEEDDYLMPPKPAQKPAPKPIKRSREEDAETSDSSEPLSKKVKKDAPNHRISDASQSSRTTTTTTYSSSSSKTKGNSPHKSSPLASSPPTNASEFENSSGRTSSSTSPARHVSSALKISRSPIHKRHQKSSSVTSSNSSSSTRSLKPEVMDLARKYRSYYPKYLNLHNEVAALGRRDTEMEDKLLDMHLRLSRMKKEILDGIVEST